MDPQGNLTDHLLGDPEAGGDRLSIYDVIVEGKPLADAILATSTPGLSVVPSHPDLAGAELDLASIIGREVLLRDAIDALPAGPDGHAGFDFVFLDCPPSLGLLSLNALAASSQVFIALQTEFFAMRGLGALDRTVDLVRRRINPALVVGGIIPTLVDSTRLAREVVDEVRSHYGDKVFVTKIRTNIRLAEAPSHGKHIFDYAPESTGALDYAQLAKELEEGRAAVESVTTVASAAAAGTASAASSASGSATANTPAPLRGIAKAIAEATAAVSAGRPVGTSSVNAMQKPAQAPAPAAVPVLQTSTSPTTTTPTTTQRPKSTPVETAKAGSPTPTAPSTVSPVRASSAVPLPVLRSGARPIPLSPMPTRPLATLPRSAPVGTPAGATRATGTTGRS